MTHPALPDDQKLAQSLQRSRLLEDAPEALVQQAIARGSALVSAGAISAAAGPGSTLVRRLVAALSFDSAGQSLALHGVRGRGDTTRQLLYSADGRDIDLRISAQPGERWRVSGQVLGPDAAGTAAIECAGHHAETAWSELSEFDFDNVPAGECTVTLRGEGWELVLPALPLVAGGAG